MLVPYIAAMSIMILFQAVGWILILQILVSGDYSPEKFNNILEFSESFPY